MKAEVNSEVYRFYKKQYAGSIIVFHVGSRYEMYNEDAVLGRSLYGTCAGDQVFSISESEMERFYSLCMKQKISVHTVSYIENGQFVLPKVNQIITDMEDDY